MVGIDEGNSKCWLINTGWTGGAHGVGKRMPIKDTRILLTAVLDNTLNVAKFRMDENFGFKVPLEVKVIDSKLLKPRETWPLGSDYDRQAQKLVRMFSENFKVYANKVDQSIMAVAL